MDLERVRKRKKIFVVIVLLNCLNISVILGAEHQLSLFIFIVLFLGYFLIKLVPFWD